MAPGPGRGMKPTTLRRGGGRGPSSPTVSLFGPTLAFPEDGVGGEPLRASASFRYFAGQPTYGDDDDDERE